MKMIGDGAGNAQVEPGHGGRGHGSALDRPRGRWWCSAAPGG
jgi:hypothetical protein